MIRNIKAGTKVRLLDNSYAKLDNSWGHESEQSPGTVAYVMLKGQTSGSALLTNDPKLEAVEHEEKVGIWAYWFMPDEFAVIKDQNNES